MNKEPKYKLIYSELDNCLYERTFIGRMTKQRYKLISRYCRKQTKEFNCGCSYDCCGHMYSQRVSFEFKYNMLTVISVRRMFNY